MDGSQYEYFVKAVLVDRLNLKADDLMSTKEPGVSFPGDPEFVHQIDWFHVDGTEVAEYITIIECKYRSSSKVDQEDLAKLAFVKSSMKASKAIMVSNQGFTKGAQALAKAERIALLTISLDEYLDETISDVDTSQVVDDLYNQVSAAVQVQKNNYEVVVVQRLLGDSNEGGLDIVKGLLRDPAIRQKAEELLRDPEVRNTVERVVRENPDIARKAQDLLRGWKF